MPELVATEADFELARIALLEITDGKTIGDPLGYIDEGDGVVTVHLASLMRGYPDWRWTVSIAHIGDAEPTVMETELTPGEAALLAPAWVPWDDRLAEQGAASDALGEVLDDDSEDPEGEDPDEEDPRDEDSDLDSDDEEPDDDDDDDVESDEDEDEATEHAVVLLHAGDLDGVDIDEIDEIDETGDLDGEVSLDGAVDLDETEATDGVEFVPGTDSGAEPVDVDEEDRMTQDASTPDGGEMGGDQDAVPADEITADSIPADGVVVDGVPTSDAPTEDSADEAGTVFDPSGESDEGLRGSLSPQ